MSFDLFALLTPEQHERMALVRAFLDEQTAAEQSTRGEAEVPSVVIGGE